MPLFDRYIAVDWSAANTPKRGKDLIWIGELGREGRVPSENPPTRDAAMAAIAARLVAARQRGERIMLGFDFVFGYPRGAAAAIVEAISDLADSLAREELPHPVPPPQGGGDQNTDAGESVSLPSGRPLVVPLAGRGQGWGYSFCTSPSVALPRH